MNEVMEIFSKSMSKPYLVDEDTGLAAYINWDWNDPSKPHEIYIFDEEELLYKRWWATGIERYFIDGYTYPGAKDEIGTLVKSVLTKLPKPRFSEGRPGGLIG